MSESMRKHTVVLKKKDRPGKGAIYHELVVNVPPHSTLHLMTWVRVSRERVSALCELARAGETHLILVRDYEEGRAEFRKPW